MINNPLDQIFVRIGRFVDSLGTKAIYSVLLLYYAYKYGEVPSWAKKIIIGSIAYFVAPIDGIPDLTPFIGMTDDISVIGYGLVTIACYINEDIRERAVNKLKSYKGLTINPSDIDEVNAWL